MTPSLIQVPKRKKRAPAAKLAQNKKDQGHPTEGAIRCTMHEQVRRGLSGLMHSLPLLTQHLLASAARTPLRRSRFRQSRLLLLALSLAQKVFAHAVASFRQCSEIHRTSRSAVSIPPSFKTNIRCTVFERCGQIEHPLHARRGRFCDRDEKRRIYSSADLLVLNVLETDRYAWTSLRDFPRYIRVA